MSTIRIEQLANVIRKRFGKTTPGHCARVDFLTRDESLAICTYIEQHKADYPFLARLLVPTTHVDHSHLSLTTDQAVEQRNLKQQSLCLFVPSDMVDAAVSSLGNSFAPIDGRDLLVKVREQIDRKLSPSASQLVRSVFAYLRGSMKVGEEQRLDCICAIYDLEQAGQLERAGLELWRVGLIADAGNRFDVRLAENSRCVRELKRPEKIQATTSERIKKLHVDTHTSSELLRFFRTYALYDVHTWSRALAEGAGQTFDQWKFIVVDPSDIRTVTIKPFLDSKGAVRKTTKLIQPEGPGTSLIASYGDKSSLAIQWETDPKTPQNLSRWLVAIVPSDIDDAEIDADIELPAREIASNYRKFTLKLDMDLEEPPDFGVRVRVTPLDSSGNQIVSAETGEKLCAESEEFVLRHESEVVIGPDPTPRDNRRTVPTIAYGRLVMVAEKNIKEMSESEPLLSSKDLDYFSLKLNKQHVLVVGLSRVLADLERRTLESPRQGGRFRLTVRDVARVTADRFEPVPVDRKGTESDEWTAFWRERERFFKQLQSAQIPRDLVETADWNDTLIKAAIKYAKSYHKLLDSLLADEEETDQTRLLGSIVARIRQQIRRRTQAGQDALMDVLSIDTALIRIEFTADNVEEAFVLLPTHPLRMAWVASYNRLLRQWEEDLLERKREHRKHAVDLDALQMLAPINVPAFAYHPNAKEPGVFFQNLHMYHGIAFTATITDPQRLFSDVATILGAQASDIPSFRLQPERLAEHINRFITLHPYTQTLKINLVNPDRGNLLATALQTVIQQANNDSGDDTEETTAPPRVHITSYVADTRKSRGEGLDALRRLATTQNTTTDTDYLLPNLSTTLRQITNEHTTLQDAHIAIGTDLTRPRVVDTPLEPRSLSSFSFNGLLCRFMLSFSTGNDGLRWHYHIVPDESAKDDVLVGLHNAILQAGGHWLNPAATHVPALEVAIDTTHQHVLERMHEQATWVITLDRFFVLDYYDSPNEPALEHVARKYLLDYAPEFVEGLGHRLMVTTTWQDEIEAILARAMHELGFDEVEQNTHDLLHYLKIISGRLVLQVFESNSSAISVVGLGIVTAWLQRTGRLANAVLVPVHSHPRIFAQQSGGKSVTSDQQCDIMLITLKRNIVEVTLIKVKWRRGRAPVEELAQDMVIQMKNTEQIIQHRFFNSDRLDGALQRTYLANVLRFYLERAMRYHLIDQDAAQTFVQNLARMEKDKGDLDFRPSYEGYIVSLDSQPREPVVIEEARITLLTANDIATATQFQNRFAALSEGGGSATTGYIKPVVPEDTTTNEPEHATLPTHKPPQQGSGQQQTNQPANQRGQGEQSNGIEPANNIIVPLGTAKGGEIAWKPGVKGSPHLFILGIPGQGKSWAVTRMLTQLGIQGVPALVLDFHGQFAETDGPFARTVSPVVLDAARGLPFSPFECTTEEGNDGWIANSYVLAEIFGYVAGLGEIQRDTVFNAIRDAYKARGFGNQSNNARDVPTLQEVLRLIETRERGNRTSNVTARCRPLLEMDLFRPDGQEFGSLVEQGVVIDLHNLYAETLQLAAGAFVLRKIYKDMFRWGPSDKLRLAIVLDEAHRLARDVTLPKIMKEGRKFGIAVIVASQGLSDFHQDIVSNVGTKVIFRVNYPESRKIAGFIRVRHGQDLAAQLEQLAVGTAYVQTPEMKYGSVVHMHPLDDNIATT